MKKYLIIFIILCTSGVTYLLFPLKDTNKFIPDPNFISLNNNQFILKGKAFYPLTLNYMVTLQADNNSLWPCQYNGYNNPSFIHRYTTKDSSLKLLKADFELIKK